MSSMSRLCHWNHSLKGRKDERAPGRVAGKEVCTNPVSFLTKAIRAAALTRWGHIRDILKGGKEPSRLAIHFQENFHTRTVSDFLGLQLTQKTEFTNWRTYTAVSGYKKKNQVPKHKTGNECHMQSRGRTSPTNITWKMQKCENEPRKIRKLPKTSQGAGYFNWMFIPANVTLTREIYK